MKPEHKKNGDDSGPRIDFLYFSGAGGTKVTAELLGEALAHDREVLVKNISDEDAISSIKESDFLVFLYPTYFLRPAPSMSEFISRLGPFNPPRPAYIVATDELYAENSVRACAQALKKRGISHAGSITLRAPGSDVTSLLPSKLTPWLYRFERKYPQKLLAAATEIRSLSSTPSPAAYMPWIKWYTPFSQLLQLLALNDFKNWKDKYRVLPERCTLCGTCAAVCHKKAWKISGTNLAHIAEKCELCTRCIHCCPVRAIVLLEPLKDNDRLNPRLYDSEKQNASTKLAELMEKS